MLFHICTAATSSASASAKTQDPKHNTILPPLLLLLLHRDDVFPITFYNHSSTWHSVSCCVKIKLDHTLAFFIAPCGSCKILKFEIFMCYAFTSTPFIPFSLYPFIRCVHRSLSYFSKYIMALKYISCALYT